MGNGCFDDFSLSIPTIGQFSMTQGLFTKPLFIFQPIPLSSLSLAFQFLMRNIHHLTSIQVCSWQSIASFRAVKIIIGLDHNIHPPQCFKQIPSRQVRFQATPSENWIGSSLSILCTQSTPHAISSFLAFCVSCFTTGRYMLPRCKVCEYSH